MNIVFVYANLLFAAFPLDRFPRKIASVPSSIDILINCAHSPRLYHRFLAKKQIIVRSLGNWKRPIQLPAVGDGWTELSERILATSDARDMPDEDRNMASRRLGRRFNGVCTAEGPVHCECLLALSLLGDSREGIPAARYLGVSKLSCLCCWMFLEGLRTSGIAFHTKGSHGKAYFPWKFPAKELIDAGLPEEERSRLVSRFFENMSRIYPKRLLELEKARKLSDSLAESGSDVGRDFEFSMDIFNI